jgi:hypothetical protein
MEIELFRNGLLLLGITKMIELVNLPHRLNVIDNHYRWLINVGCALSLIQFTFIKNIRIIFYMKRKV